MIIILLSMYFIFLLSIAVAIIHYEKYNDLKNAIGTKEAAEILGIDRADIYGLIANNCISPVIKKGKYLFLRKEIEALKNGLNEYV